MKGNPTIMAAIAAVLSAPCGAAPQTHPGSGSPAQAEARKAIQAAYDAEDSACLREDVRGLMADEAPDYRLINSDGTRVVPAQERNIYPQTFRMLTPSRSHTVVKKFRLDGSTATVVIQQRLEGAYRGAGVNGKGLMVVQSTGEDIWVRAHGKWLKRRSTVFVSNTTLNGRSVGGG